MKKGYYFLFLKQNPAFNLGTPIDAKTSFSFLAELPRARSARAAEHHG